MDTEGIHMVEGMDMVKEHPSKERLRVEGMDMVVKQSSKERPEVEDMDMEGTDMVEDMTVEVVKRDDEGVVLARHWIDDGAKRRQ
jgi:hypothetical protein